MLSRVLMCPRDAPPVRAASPSPSAPLAPNPSCSTAAALCSDACVLSDCFHIIGFNLNTIYIFQNLFSNLLRLF